MQLQDTSFGYYKNNCWLLNTCFILYLLLPFGPNMINWSCIKKTQFKILTFLMYYKPCLNNLFKLPSKISSHASISWLLYLKFPFSPLQPLFSTIRYVHFRNFVINTLNVKAVFFYSPLSIDNLVKQIHVQKLRIVF